MNTNTYRDMEQSNAILDMRYLDDVPTVNDTISYVCQQIAMLFDTRKGDVLGNYTFGTDYEDFIWDMTLPASAIAAQINDDIAQNIDLAGCTYSVKADIINGTENDIILVQIDLMYEGRMQTVAYSIG